MKRTVVILLSLIMFLSLSQPVLADSEPYEGYEYDFWDQVIPSPLAYIPLKTMNGLDLGVGVLNRPKDMCVYDDKLYVMDTGNNRLVIFDKDLNYERTIDSFVRDGNTERFNQPNGVFVAENGDIYIADTDNHRIVVLDENGAFIMMVDPPPVSDIFTENYVFAPMKVVVDNAGKIFTVVRNEFEGLMSFDQNGEFIRYFGTITLTVSWTTYIWRFIATQEQRSRMRMYIPTEFTNLDVDDKGFIFTTNLSLQRESFIRRLNPHGKDVIVNYNEDQLLMGDLRFRDFGLYSGPSQLVDIMYEDGNGIYRVLDYNRGRVFTYDTTGNLLYVFAGIGNILGMVDRPVALALLGDNVIVLDDGRNALVFYEPTEYGRLINSAIKSRYEGDEAGAVEIWRDVLRMDSNNQLANRGVGRSLLAAGEYREAMDYLELGMDRKQYSEAFRFYRNDILRDNLPVILTVALAVLVLFVAYRILTAKKRKLKNMERED